MKVWVLSYGDSYDGMDVLGVYASEAGAVAAAEASIADSGLARWTRARVEDGGHEWRATHPRGLLMTVEPWEVRP